MTIFRWNHQDLPHRHLGPEVLAAVRGGMGQSGTSIRALDQVSLPTLPPPCLPLPPVPARPGTDV